MVFSLFFCVAGGDIGHKFILNALEANNQSETLYLIHTSDTFPSYGSILASGATSLPEQWDGDGSQLHSMLGHAEEWLFSTVLGIRCKFDACTIRPRPHARRIDATTAPAYMTQGSFHSATCGKVAVTISWDLLTGVLVLQVETPAPKLSTCRGWTVHVPADDLSMVTTLSAGAHVEVEARTFKLLQGGVHEWRSVYLKALI